MRLIKLTDENGNTRGGMHWEIGITHEVNVPGTTLCTNQVIHAYTSELLAAFMHPAHISIKNPLAFMSDGEVVSTDGTKVGVKNLTITGTATLPKLTLNQRIAFGILCAKQVYHEKKWVEWADRWLDGSNRTSEAASDVASAAYAALSVAAYAIASVVASGSAYVVAYEAVSVAAASAAHVARTVIDFQALAEQALEY